MGGVNRAAAAARHSRQMICRACNCEGGGHVCKHCSASVHAWVNCQAVLMPKEDVYFCSEHCLHEYNPATLDEHHELYRRPWKPSKPIAAAHKSISSAGAAGGSKPAAARPESAGHAPSEPKNKPRTPSVPSQSERAQGGAGNAG